jgi:magnesium-transporting ATPase (P-type)
LLSPLSNPHIAGAVAVRPDSGTTAPEPKTSPKTLLFKSNLVLFLCLLRIQNPKYEKTHKTSGSEEGRTATKLSLFFLFLRFFSSSYFFLFLFVVVGRLCVFVLLVFEGVYVFVEVLFLLLICD